MSATTDDPADVPEREQPSVLVVDDQQRVADLYRQFLEDDHDVTTAYGGEEALAVVDDSFDVVLLDRRMPELAGDDVLAAIRNRNLGCGVAMVTAIEPDLDVIDMRFDDYVVKPASREDLRTTVERLVLMAELEDVEYELSSLRVKRNVLEAEMRDAALADNEEFARLQDRIEQLRGRLTELRGRLDDVVPGAAGVA